MTLAEGLTRLGLRGKPVAVHSSLRSLGPIEGGAEAVVRILQDEYPVILMPAFFPGANALPPPAERPSQNGCDYAIHFDPIQPPPPFLIETAPINPKMGALARVFAGMADVSRSDHPWLSWSGWSRRRGEALERFLEPHPWTTANLPVERLAEADGWVLLLGVTLTSCTAVHVAEERAGRRPFVRWAIDRTGQLREVRLSGCARGFDALLPICRGRDWCREERVGACQILALQLNPLISACAAEMRANPEVTRCPTPGCLRCRDAILGGPIMVAEA